MNSDSIYIYSKPVKLILCILLTALLVACGGSNNDNSNSQQDSGDDQSSDDNTLDLDLRELIASKDLTGDPAEGRSLPTIDDPVAQLGMKLFFSKALGGDMDSACVTCHHPVLGGGDDLSLPVGVDAEIVDLLGPGRFHSMDGEHFDGGPTVPRNAPSTFNIALWDQVLFHDGRIESLGKTAGVNGMMVWESGHRTLPLAKRIPRRAQI